MSDDRDIPKSLVSDCASSQSLFAEDSGFFRLAADVKSHSSLSTHPQQHQVMIGHLIEECTKGAYSKSERLASLRTRKRAQETTTTTTTPIISNAIDPASAIANDAPKKLSKKWTVREVRRLHRCVEIFGTDFSIIAKLFPTRKRSELMNKFKKEGKKDLSSIERTMDKHSSMRLSRHLVRKNSLRKESLLSVNSLDSADIVHSEQTQGLVNEVRRLVGGNNSCEQEAGKDC